MIRSSEHVTVIQTSPVQSVMPADLTTTVLILDWDVSHVTVPSRHTAHSVTITLGIVDVSRVLQGERVIDACQAFGTTQRVDVFRAHVTQIIRVDLDVVPRPASVSACRGLSVRNVITVRIDGF